MQSMHRIRRRGERGCIWAEDKAVPRGRRSIANTLPRRRNSLSCVGEQCESRRTSERGELQGSCYARHAALSRTATRRRPGPQQRQREQLGLGQRWRRGRAGSLRGRSDPRVALRPSRQIHEVSERARGSSAWNQLPVWSDLVCADLADVEPPAVTTCRYLIKWKGYSEDEKTWEPLEVRLDRDQGPTEFSLTPRSTS